MVAEWKGDDGRDLQATIESQYSLNHNEKLPSLHWRHLKFATEHKENAYRQVRLLNRCHTCCKLLTDPAEREDDCDGQPVVRLSATKHHLGD